MWLVEATMCNPKCHVPAFSGAVHVAKPLMGSPHRCSVCSFLLMPVATVAICGSWFECGGTWQPTSGDTSSPTCWQWRRSWCLEFARGDRRGLVPADGRSPWSGKAGLQNLSHWPLGLGMCCQAVQRVLKVSRNLPTAIWRALGCLAFCSDIIASLGGTSMKWKVC